MRLENLPKTKEMKASKRVGRGPGSGMGKTSTRGENGQKSRSGASIKAWFQGGQTPLYRRIPIRGFNNKQFETKFAIINLSEVLGNGELTKKLTVKANRFSTKAVTKIENIGGKAEVI